MSSIWRIILKTLTLSMHLAMFAYATEKLGSLIAFNRHTDIHTVHYRKLKCYLLARKQRDMSVLELNCFSRNFMTDSNVSITFLSASVVSL